MITLPFTEAMPSRVATSICVALDCGQEMVCQSLFDYSKRAKKLALGTLEVLNQEQKVNYNNLPQRIKDLQGSPELKLLRWKVEQNRLVKPLFQT